MTRRQVSLFAALALAAALVVGVAGRGAETRAATQTLLVTGQLHDAQHAAAAGSVRVYAWPYSDGAMALPLVGQAQTDGAGNFAVYATDPAQLQRLAVQRGGWLDFVAVGDTAGGYEGEWTFSSFIASRGGVVRSLAPDSVDAARAAAATSRSFAPRIAFAADRRAPERTARAAQLGHCKTGYWVQPTTDDYQWAIVGELNNAYNDGTKARFSYAQEHTADTDFGVAISNDSGDNWEIHGTNHVGSKGTLDFPTFQKRVARKMKSYFKFTRQAARADTCADWSVKIRATGWQLGTDFNTKQNGTLDKCDPRFVGHINGGARFKRDSNAAVRWTNGVTAFGVSLTTQSGFSEDVTLSYAFGGGLSKLHYLCGPDGRQDPTVAGRVFSGARN